MTENIPRFSIPINLFKQFRPEDNFGAFLVNGVRHDGRLVSQARTIAIKRQVIIDNEKYDSPILGSSQVRIGGTTIVTTVQALVGTPSLVHPNKGDIVCKIFSDYVGNNNNKHSLDSKFLEKFVVDIITKGNVLNLEELCITEGKYVFQLCLSASIASNDGNLREALVISALSALCDCQLPTPVCCTNSIKFDLGCMKPLVINFVVPVTLGIFEEYHIIDPTIDEELIMHGLLFCVLRPESGEVVFSELSSQAIEINTIDKLCNICRKHVQTSYDQIKHQLSTTVSQSIL